MHLPPRAYQVPNALQQNRKEALGIPQCLENLYHSSFARKVNVITYHKWLVAIFKKDNTTLSQLLQHILLRFLQYKVGTLYKPGPGLYIMDWLSKTELQGEQRWRDRWHEIRYYPINVTTSIPACMTIHDIPKGNTK